MSNFAQLLMFVACFTVGGVWGCEGLDTVNCDTSAAAGLSIVVTQGEGGPVLCDAIVTISNGVVSEKLEAAGTPCTYTGAYERPGTWTVAVSKAGLQAETKNGVVVEMGQCHVQTQRLTIVLKL